MNYRANKIRQALIQRIAEVEWPPSLDPYPVQCAQDSGDRHAILGLAWCGTFAPRPEFEQDRSKYE